MITEMASDPEIRRLETAARWVVRLRESPEDESLLLQWLAWCEAAPENHEAFRQIQDTWQVAGEAYPAADPGAPESTPEDAPRHEASPETSATSGGNLWPVGMARAAAVVLLIGAGALLYGLVQSFPGAPALSTPLAMHGSSELPDGSRVELGALSRVTTHYTEGERRVVVESGEAFFDVEHDPARPFVVEAGDLAVTAVGTAFNVHRDGKRVTVTVSEGRVRVKRVPGLLAEIARVEAPPPIEADAGEQARFSPAEKRITVAAVNPAMATAWRDGALKFVHEPLDAVVSDLNRYSHRRIVIDDPELHELRYTGTVISGRLDEWIRAVEDVFPVRVVAGEDRIVLKRRIGPAAPAS